MVKRRHFKPAVIGSGPALVNFCLLFYPKLSTKKDKNNICSVLTLCSPFLQFFLLPDFFQGFDVHVVQFSSWKCQKIDINKTGRKNPFFVQNSNSNSEKQVLVTEKSRLDTLRQPDHHIYYYYYYWFVQTCSSQPARWIKMPIC